MEPAAGPLGGDTWAGMTFPLYRPLLALLGSGEADAAGVRPVAHLARIDEVPVGLVLAGLPTAERASAELLSVFIDADFRNQGVATFLLAGLEADLAARGVRELEGVYMAGKPGIDALERVFVKRGFTAPVLRKVVVQCTPEEASRTDWFRKAKMPAGATIFPWAELTPDEYATLRRSQAEQPWIPQILEPWSCGPNFDQVSSVGMRLDGRVVGWILNHRVAPNLVRFTACFVRADLQRRGGMFPLLVASLERLMGTGAVCTFVTTNQFPEMVSFTHRRLGPFVSYCGETRGVSKALAQPGDATLTEAPAAGPDDPADAELPMLAVQDEAGRDAWNDFVEGHPDGHVFQRWEWGEVQAGMGAQPIRIAAVGADGHIAGCVQVLVFDTGSRVFSYIPRGPVCGADDDRTRALLVDAAVQVSLAAGANLVRFEPQWARTEALDTWFRRRRFAEASQHIMPPRTILVDLAPSPETILSAFRSTTRNRIRVAEKRGVTVREGREADVGTFVRLLDDTNARHGLRPTNHAQYTLAAQHFGRADRVRLFLASADGADHAGIMVFVSGTWATYLWGASEGSEEARHLNPNQLLHWTAMQWARARGCTTYDLFGVPDADEAELEARYATEHGGWWNLYRFKRGFGGRVHRHLGTYDFTVTRG
jgi:peptidoglycan pentaglycine glycine transferase (the first glycine)